MAPGLRGALILGAGLTLSIALLLMVWQLAQPLMLLIVAIIIAQALAAPIAWMARWIPRGLAILIAYLMVFLVLIGVFVIIVPPLFEEGEAIVANAPEFIDQLNEWFSQLDQGVADQIVSWLVSAAETLASMAVVVPFTVFSSVIDVVVVVATSVYWIISSPALKRWILSLVPSWQRDHADNVMISMGQTMGGYARGSVIDGAINGTLTYVGLTLLGVEYALVLALLSFFGEFLPMIGPVLAAIPAIAVALIDSWQLALAVTVFYIVLQQFESNVLVPYIMKGQANVPPLLTLVAVSAGLSLAGIIGAIIAIPLFGAIRVLIVQVVAPAIRNWTRADDEEEPERDQNQEQGPEQEQSSRWVVRGRERTRHAAPGRVLSQRVRRRTTV